MAVQKQDDQHEHTLSSYVRIRDVVLRRWTIGRSDERGSGISVLLARHDDDDDEFWHDLITLNWINVFIYIFIKLQIFVLYYTGHQVIKKSVTAAYIFNA